MCFAKMVGVVSLVAAAVTVGCSAGPARVAESGAASSQRAAAPKRVTLAVVNEPTALRAQLSRSSAGSLPGSAELEQLVHAGLGVLDPDGKIQPQLGEVVPTLENGGWKLLPGGRMETVWKIRQGARWHDGQPVAAADFVFTSIVARDKELAQFRNPAFDYVDTTDAPDPSTLVVHWARPWISADALFTGSGAVPVLPMPRHILEAPYAENKATFADLAFWSDEFVGAGPYRLKQFSRGSHLVLTAVPEFVLGQPKVDEITVKVILDRGALVANLLAGEVDMPIGNTLSFEEALHLKDQWRGGTVEFTPSNALKLWPQFRNPNPRVVADVRFRRALLHATDRQAMADSLGLGQSSVSDSSLSPLDPEYDELKSSFVRYAYDPRLAAEMIAGLGYTRGSDDLWRDRAGQRLTIDSRTIQRDILIKSVYAAAEDWKNIGITVETMILTPQQRSDREFYATYPAFDAAASNNGVDDFYAFHSSEAKTPENRYTGSNRSSYVNPELDSLVDRFYTTIATGERMQVAKRIVHHVTDQLVFLPLFYDLRPTMVSGRMVNVPLRVGTSGAPTANAHIWDVRS